MKLLPTLLLVSLASSASLLSSTAPVAQDAEEARDRLGLFEYFLGDWTGTGTGPDGTSTMTRSYELVLGRFVQAKTRAAFTRADGTPGEVHEDWGMLSWDGLREVYVLREFHVEGYVNQYVPTISEDGATFVFTTEAIENLAPGWRARLTQTIVDDDTFEETFELCPPEGEFFHCGGARLVRG